jgi:hypothetical protein
MKWTKPQYVKILLQAISQYHEANSDDRDEVVHDVRRDIKNIARENDFTAPTGLTEVNANISVHVSIRLLII